MSNSSTDNLNCIDESLLPPQIRKLARVIGLPDTLHLLKHRGGRPLRVPVHVDRALELRQVLSIKTIKLLVEHLPGERFDLPKPDKIVEQLRNYAIIHSSDNNCKLAAQHRLTRRHIINIKKKADEEDPTADLFG